MSFDQVKSSQNKDGYCIDTLCALVERGPLDAGDVPSKTGLAELIEHGMASAAIVKGADGFYVATYHGRDLYCKHYGGKYLQEVIKTRPRYSQNVQRG